MDTIIKERSCPNLSCCQNGSTSENISNDGDGDGDSTELDYTQGNNNTMFHTNNNEDNNCGYTFPKRETVDLKFEDVRYTVKSLSILRRKIECKEIVHGIAGEFKSGQVTAIMGPSGAGKTSLLNIMAGYVCSGVTGKIEVNGKLRSNNSEKFRTLSCYIHQNDTLRGYLTVKESMMIATHLKLGYNISQADKEEMIKQILVLLGLSKRYNTYTRKLSGGQKKRLSIALELISNPPILFLDEPTTGLDSASCTKCISLLKRLAQEGRTVVCTIHQPSALVFEMFDHLYALAGGQCIYQGPIKELVPYLGNMGLSCPNYHNPADFLIEVAIGEYGSDIIAMVSAANKKYIMDSEILYSSHKPVSREFDDIKFNDFKNSKKPEEFCELTKLKNNKNICFDEMSTNTKNSDFVEFTNRNDPASLFMQFFLLYKRNLLCSKRNYFLVCARIFCHVFIAVVFGYLYIGVGSTANTVIANYVYLYGSILLIVYTGKVSVMMSFPVEMEILTREHFNRWYKLGPYFLSVILFEIPFQIICASLYIVISYYLTGNSTELFRFSYFLLMCILATLCAQSWGFFIGATLPIKLAVFCGPVLAVLFSIFGFCTRYIDITPLFRWMWHISYFRAAFHSSLNVLYGMDRAYLDCPSTVIYCHFRDPEIFLDEMLIHDVNMENNFILLLGVILVMHFLTVFTLWYKLNKR